MPEIPRSFPRLIVLPALLAAACSTPVVRPDGGVGLLPSGATAPEVVGHDAQSHEVRLSSLKGSMAVVFFYPKDASPGCTREVCAIRDNWKEFEKAGIGVIGVSSDSVASHDSWLKREHLQFALASDESGAVARSYGVGKMLWGYDRVTFLVGPDGHVAHVWPSVDPAVHARDILAAVEQLRSRQGGKG